MTVEKEKMKKEILENTWKLKGGKGIGLDDMGREENKMEVKKDSS